MNNFSTFCLSHQRFCVFFYFSVSMQSASLMVCWKKREEKKTPPRKNACVHSGRVSVSFLLVFEIALCTLSSADASKNVLSISAHTFSGFLFLILDYFRVFWYVLACFSSFQLVLCYFSAVQELVIETARFCFIALVHFRFAFQFQRVSRS